MHVYWKFLPYVMVYQGVDVNSYSYAFDGALAIELIEITSLIINRIPTDRNKNIIAAKALLFQFNHIWKWWDKKVALKMSYFT